MLLCNRFSNGQGNTPVTASQCNQTYVALGARHRRAAHVPSCAHKTHTSTYVASPAPKAAWHATDSMPQTALACHRQHATDSTGMPQTACHRQHATDSMPQTACHRQRAKEANLNGHAMNNQSTPRFMFLLHLLTVLTCRKRGGQVIHCSALEVCLFCTLFMACQAA